MARTAQQDRLTLREAIEDLGWFYATFSALVSGPSLLDLLQMVFEHRLIDALQWIVDGYHDIAAVVGAVLEPLLRPPLAWLNALFGWRLELQPHWKPVFLLAMVFVTGLSRAVRRESVLEAVLFGILLSLGALTGAVAAGLSPLAGGWWAQGVAAAAPVGMVSLLLGAPLALTAAGRARALPNPLRELCGVVLNAFVLAGVAFAIGAGVSFLPGLSRGAGLLALGGGVLIIGVLSLLAGLAEADRMVSSIGLTLLGGFATAGLIVAVDAVLKVIAQ